MAKIFTNPDASFATGLISFHSKNAPIARDDANTTTVMEAYSQQPVYYSQSVASPYRARHFKVTGIFALLATT